MKYIFLKIPPKSQKSLVSESHFNKVAGLQPETLLKKALAQVFSFSKKSLFLQNTSG